MSSISAAAGVKIAAPDLDEALAGAPLYVVPSDHELADYVKMVSHEVERVKIARNINGVVLKTDALGSLEAIAESLKREGIPIRVADVGDVAKRDIMEALAVKGSEPTLGVVLAFNVKTLPDAEGEAKDRGIRIFQHNVIYHLIDELTDWVQTERRKGLVEEFDRLTRPGKLRVIPGYVFRKAKPAIVGVEVLAGQIKPGVVLVKNDGEDVGEIRQIQEKGNSISKASSDMQVAISLDKPIVGRHINENDVLYVQIPESNARMLLTKFKSRLTPKELETLIELVEFTRRITSPFWAA
jgi:translation initiation factor 5B